MNILEDLYFGAICPYEKPFEQKNESARFAETITNNEEKLTLFLKNLPDAKEEQHLLSQMINAQSEYSQFSEVEKFAEGFRLGALLMCEVFAADSRQNAQ